VYGRGGQTPRFSIGPPITPPVVKNLLIAIGVIFVAQYVIFGPGVTRDFSVQSVSVWQAGYFWQPFTYMWLHGSFGHVLLNGFVLWMFGSQVAMAWGARRFLRFYLVCGVGAGFLISLWPYVAVELDMASPLALGVSTLGASGAIYGVMLAYSLTWPDRTIMLIFPPVAFRAIWLIPIVFGMTLFMSGSNVSHVGHLGGVLVGWIYLRFSGKAGPLFSVKHLRYRWQRYRMRRNLRTVQTEEMKRRQRRNDRTIH
jgi:membrane associated rhomboid family serine protease